MFHYMKGSVKMGLAAETINNALKKKKISQIKICKEMEMSNKVLSQQLNVNSDIGFAKVVDVLEYAGFHIEIVEDNFKRVKDIRKLPSSPGVYWSVTKDGFLAVDNRNTGHENTAFCETKKACFDWMNRQLQK